MQTKKSISLQSQLIKTSLLSAVWAGVISLFLMLGFSLYYMMDVHDELMDQVADMLLSTDLRQKTAEQVDELSDEFEIYYQLKRGAQVLTESENQHKHFPQMAFEHGHHFIWDNGQLWRSYQQQDDQFSVQILQPIKVRFKESLQSVAGYSAILLVVWLIQWLLLHILIKRRLQSLQLFSSQIAQKSIDDLAPITLASPALKELEPIQTQLNHLLQRLDAALQAEQRFTSDASHELRSPLSAIQMRLQVLQRKYPEIQPDLNAIQQDVSRGTRVLENLLMLARLDPTQTDQLQKKQADLEQITLHALDALAPFSEQKQIEFSIQTQSITMPMNTELMFSALRNLIDNAIRYSPEQGVVKIQMHTSAHQIVWTIENSGEGISKEQLERIGERFYRVLGTKTSGSGLGISIAQKIIQLHHGDFDIQTSALGGLKLSLTFPYNDSEI